MVEQQKSINLLAQRKYQSAL